MISKKIGKVVEIEEQSCQVQWLKVDIKGNPEPAVNFPCVSGNVAVGDEVVVNATSFERGLGDEYHIVIVNLNNLECDAVEQGKIMKMRYSPSQIKVFSVEEPESPHHESFKSFKNLGNMPVMVGSLHSMLAPAALGYKLMKPKERLVYIMTDGGALPIAFSRTLPDLKKVGLIDGTVTIGHAFGGDCEAVNIYSGLIAAKEVLKADAVIVSMGPRVVGTATKWGFTGIEQGDIINAVNILNGNAIAIPRITFKAKLDRHKGLSHHTLTILERVAMQPALVALPELPEKEMAALKQQIKDKRLDDKHTFITAKADQVLDYAAQLQIPLSTMGRTEEEERFYFLAAGAAGILAGKEG